MSHHLDTPLAQQNGQLYIDDLYVFGGEDSTVFVMDVNSTITGPDVKPGFSPDARYEFKIHVGGSEQEQLAYRVSFGEPDGDGQPLSLAVLIGADAADDDAAGAVALEGRTREAARGEGTRIWAGSIADPFYIDLHQLAAVNAAFKNGAAVDWGAWRPEAATNTFAGTTVESIVLEVAHDRNPRIARGADLSVWCATKLATDAGGWRQINRAGHPMMWPIFWPDDTDFSNPANGRRPAADFEADGKYIADAVAAVVRASGTSSDPQGYSQTVARTLLPDVLPYVAGAPATYGFARRNGRALADNAPEVMFSMVTNSPVRNGLGPSTNAALRTGQFPYVVPA
jgi:hypothetical protein